MRLKEMKISSRLKGGIYEVSFGYNPEMEGYATLMSDISKLGEIQQYGGWDYNDSISQSD